MTGKDLPTEVLKKTRESNRAGAQEKDFQGLPGYARRYRKDGTYEWRYRFRPNAYGRPTKEAERVRDLMLPSFKISTQRAALMAQASAASAALVGSTTDADGWSRPSRVGGNPVERGVDGMLFRWSVRRWEPLGVRCLGTPLFDHGPLKSPQRDPDGHLWWGEEGEWLPA